MHNATAQSFNIFLYFALSCAEALLNTILIPMYSSTDNSPTTAIVLNAIYQLAIFFCILLVAEGTEVEVYSINFTFLFLPFGVAVSL